MKASGGARVRGADERCGEREAERWLRAVGLPSFVRAGAAGDRLLVRVVPFVVFALMAGLLFSGLLQSLHLDIDVESVALAVLIVALLLVVVLALVVIPLATALLVARWLRRRPQAALPTGIIALVGYLVVLPLIIAVRDTPEWALIYAAGHVLTVLTALLLTWLGVGSLLAWVVRAALSQMSAIGALITRALPILMLVIVFAFFSRPVWEVTSTMSVSRLLAVAVFFAVLGVLFVVPISRGEMKELDAGIGAADRIAFVRAAGLDDLVGHASQPGPPLGRLERLNLQSVLVFALGLQTVLFAVIVCVFLILLGGIAFSNEVLEEWVGDRLTHIELFGTEIPFTWALVKTAIFLSCVSSLNFLVSVTTNSAYRNAFFRPLVHEARTALAVRAAYLHRAAGAAPVDPASSPVETPAQAITNPDPHLGPDIDDESELGMIEPGPGSAG